MSTMLIQSETLEDIADAIREKTSSLDSMTPLEMPTNIASIPTGGGNDLILFRIENIPTYTSQANYDFTIDYTGSVNVLICQSSVYNANTKIGILLNGTEVSYTYASENTTPYYFRERQNLSVTSGDIIRFRKPQTASKVSNIIMIIVKNT